MSEPDPLVWSLLLEYIGLHELIQCRQLQSTIRNEIDAYLTRLVKRAPWRVAVDYSVDFVKVYVTYGWTNFNDIEVTNMASDYHKPVSSTVWYGSGDNIAKLIWQACKRDGTITVNLNPTTMTPCGLNQTSWGIVTKIQLGHGAELNHLSHAPDWERNLNRESTKLNSFNLVKSTRLNFQRVTTDTHRTNKLSQRRSVRHRKWINQRQVLCTV